MRVAVDVYLRVSATVFVNVSRDDPDVSEAATEKAYDLLDEKRLDRILAPTIRVDQVKVTPEGMEEVTGGWRKPRKRRRR